MAVPRKAVRPGIRKSSNSGPLVKDIGKPVQRVVEPEIVEEVPETTPEPAQTFSGELVASPAMFFATAQDGFTVNVAGKDCPVVLWFARGEEVVPGIVGDNASIVPVTDYESLRSPQGTVTARTKPDSTD